MNGRSIFIRFLSLILVTCVTSAAVQAQDVPTEARHRTLGHEGLTYAAGAFGALVPVALAIEPAFAGDEAGIFLFSVSTTAFAALLGMSIARFVEAGDMGGQLDRVLTPEEIRFRYANSFFNPDGTFGSLSLPACRGLGVRAPDCPDAMRAWESDLPYLNRLMAEFRELHAERLRRVEQSLVQRQSTSLASANDLRFLLTAFQRMVEEELVDYVSESSLQVLQSLGGVLLAVSHTSSIPASSSLNFRLDGGTHLELSPAGVGLRF